MRTDSLIGAGGAAQRLGVSVTRVRQLARAGQLEVAAVIGGRHLYRARAVEALARRRRIEAARDPRVKVP